MPGHRRPTRSGLPLPRLVSVPHRVTIRNACWRRFPGRRHSGYMTMSPDHAGLPRLVDRFDPDQVRALRAAARQLLRPTSTNRAPAKPRLQRPNRCWPTSRCGTCPSSGCSTVRRISPSAPGESCARSSRSAPMPITDTWPLGRCSTPRTGTTRYLPRCSGGSATRLSSRPDRHRDRLPTPDRAGSCSQGRVPRRAGA
jgi:hypothetical protein